MSKDNNATHGAQTVPFSFSTGATMTFKTHNDTDININGTHGQGNVTAAYKELCSLFGKPTAGDGYKVDAEWAVMFDDGTVATIYNWKNGKNYEGENGLPVEQIEYWNIGGMTSQAATNVQIALDLYREQAKEKFADPMEKALSPAFDMMASIKANKGEDYGTLLELALLAQKSMELINVLISGLVIEEHMPKEVGVAMNKTSAHITAKMIGLAAKLGKIDTNKHSAEELMDWAEKLMKLESDGVKTLVKDLDGDA
jgi:hypothetical protein